MNHPTRLLPLLLTIAAPVLAAPEQGSPAWVDERVAAWQPTAREKAWERIGWATDLRGAQRLAKQHRRPVFLFTLDGRMDVGRC